MKLESLSYLLENADRGSVLSKQQILSGYLKMTKIGRLAFQDFKDGKPRRFVLIMRKGKEESEEDEGGGIEGAGEEKG